MMPSTHDGVRAREVGVSRQAGRPLAAPARRFVAGAMAAMMLAATVIAPASARAPGVIASVSRPIDLGATSASAAPAAPVVISPANYSASSANPVLRWKPVVGAVRYQVDVRPAPSPGLIGGTCSGETTGLSMVCDELPPGAYTWTVQSVGPAYLLGARSATRSFVKQPRLTTAPVLLSPASGSTFHFPAGLGVLRWAPLPDAAYYQVQTSTDPTFPGALGPEYARLTTEAQVIVPEVLDKLVYWRVRGVTDYGQSAGPWSSTRSYRLRWTAVPQPISPADGATVSTVTLAWQPMAGAYRYDIEFTTPGDPTFADPILITDSDRPSFAPGSVSETSFLWRVRAKAINAVTSPWSPARLLTIDPGAPPSDPAPPFELPPVTLTSPADGATNVVPKTTPLEFEWALGALGHDVQVVPADQEWYHPGGDWANGLGGPQIPVLDAGTTYKWRVRADATNFLEAVGPWSEERTFTTAPLGTVSLLAPADGATKTNEELMFSWKPLPSAPIHYVDLSRSADFESPATIHSYADGLAASRGALEPGVWFWRVRAGRDQTSAISAVRTLTIVDTTPPVGSQVLANPVASTTVDFVHVRTGGAEDAITEVSTAAISADGVAWTEYPFPSSGDVGWSLVTPAYGGTTPGYRTIKVRWRDTTGNWSTPLSTRVWYGEFTDTIRPTVTGPRIVSIIPMGSVSPGGQFRARVDWSASDDTGLGVKNELRWLLGGPCCPLDAQYLQQPGYDVTVGQGRTFQFMATAIDAAQNGASATGPQHPVFGYTETSTAVTYRGSWANAASTTQYLGGKAKASSTAGATATFRVTGRSVALVSRRGPTRGMATIYVNGVRVAVIDTYSRTYIPRQIVWSMDWATSATRTIVVRVAATPGRPRFDLDGFMAIR